MLIQLALLADYNRWINQQLYTVASSLSTEELAAPRGAFFGSILGSFNHILVADLIWLKRFLTHTREFPTLATELQAFPTPTRLNQILFNDFNELWLKRRQLDEIIMNWVNSLTPEDLVVTLSYANMQGTQHNKNFLSLLLHFFTHQIHHRGQITTLFSQAGLDFGETDLLLRIPNSVEAL